MSLAEDLRRLYSVKTPYSNGRAVGQMMGCESYILIATGITLGGLIDAADELDRLTKIYDEVNAGLRKMGANELADMVELAKKNADLTAELAAAKKDAERYRWLRHGDVYAVVNAFGAVVTVGHRTEMTPPCYLPRIEELDAAIDAAMEAK